MATACRRPLNANVSTGWNGLRLATWIDLPLLVLAAVTMAIARYL